MSDNANVSSPPPSRPGRVVAVVVAYNRCDLLKKCLLALKAQTIPLLSIVVIDNASTDDSAAVAQSLGASVVTLPRNTGGAGGFAAGIAHALTQFPQASHVWLMDDDTIPRPDSLRPLLKAARQYCGTPSLLSSRVIALDGSDHPLNTHRQRPLLTRKQKQKAYAVGATPVRAASFVSVLIDAQVVRAEGLPVADYFLWNDDLEYTARVLRRRTGLMVSESQVDHMTARIAGNNEDPGERFHFEVRNKIWFLLYSPGLDVVDRLLYGASTLRRWFRIYRSTDRRSGFLKDLQRGCLEGIKRPESTVKVLRNLGDISDEVERVESASRYRR